MSTHAARPGAPGVSIATGVLVAAALWTAVNLLALSNVLDPLPDGTGRVSVALFVVAAVTAGIAAGSWWVLPLAVVPAIVANAVGAYDDVREPIPVAELGVPVWGALIAAGVVIAGVSTLGVRRVTVAVVALLAGALALVAGFRTLWPRDATPAAPVAVMDIAAGRAGTVSLGDALDAAATRLDARRYRQAGPPFREPVPGVGLPGTVDLAIPYSVARGRGITLIGRGGRVTAILLTRWDAQTTTGIGVGDNLALVRHRHPGARCERNRELDRPECVVTSGRRLAVFAGDPIAVIALTAPAAREPPPLTPAGGAAAP